MARSRSIEAYPKHNLPPQPTSFVGREPEIAEIVKLLNDPNCRLLTLVGPGGIGKTRLAIEAASRKIEAFPHGIFFVTLAPLSTAADIVPTVINTLGIFIGDDGTPREELVKYLIQRNLLLIMDNFEHMLDGADLMADILNAAPDVKVLATSREALNLRMERVWHVRGMRYPETDQPENIDQYSALKLFIDRATWVRREFSPVDEQACAIRICQLVGGMPLAIELAAAWRKNLACAEIVAEIQRSIDFLATSVRDVPERHRSIRAVCDHSWSLCNETEQAVFSKLCVFRGGFEREAAEEIAGASLLTLSALVEKSMLQKLPSGRYEIHELLRQYAEDKLTATDKLAATEESHTRYYAEFMQARTPDIKGRRQLEGLNEIEADFENLRAAWQRAIVQVDYDALDQMMEGLALFCDMRARYQLGEDLFQQAVDALAPKAGKEAHRVWNRLRARWIQVWILPERVPTPDPIREQLEDSLTIARKHGDTATIALCLWSSGELHRIERVSAEGIPLYEIALTHFNDLGDKYYIVRVLRGMVYSIGFMGRDHWGKMQEWNHEHLNLASEIGDRTGMGHAVFYEAAISHRIARSRVGTGNHLLQALEIWQEMGDLKSVGVVLGFLGTLNCWQGEFEKAKTLLAGGVKIQEDVNYWASMGFAVGSMGLIAGLEEDYAKAYQLCQHSLTFSQHLGPVGQFGLFIAAMGAGDLKQAKEYLKKILYTVDFLVDMTAALPVTAQILAHEGENVLAAELVGLAFTHPMSITGWMEKWPLLNQLRHDLEAELGTEAYLAAWDRGKHRDLDETIAELRDYFDPEQMDTPKHTSQPLVEPLSERELEVLALLADGLSNREIAEKLYLSVGTVKVHTRNIYGKLSVSNRTEAAATARKLNLI